jgi:hypothetical protein
MNVRFKKTDKGDIAILPRKEYEALAAKAAEADEDIGSAKSLMKPLPQRSPAFPPICRRGFFGLPSAFPWRGWKA